MLKFLYGFILFLLAYFVISVSVGYYLSFLQYGKLIIPIIKELTWFVGVGIACWLYRDSLIVYWRNSKYIGLLLGGIILWGIIATLLINYFNNSLDSTVLINILIGLKYGLYATVVFYTAGFIGFASSITESELLLYIRYICKAILRCLGLGIIWQLLKWIAPGFFYDILGYGPIGDYIAGQAHPIYYRTGAGGFPRFSGLMSGPNNLGYLLVAYASVIPLYFTQWWIKLLYYGTTLATVSRAAIIGVGSQLLVASIKGFRTNKMIIVISVSIGLLGIIALSIIKGPSTLEHITRTLGSLQQVIHSPRGIGLGSSGPGVHRGGSVLPENYYLQLLLDYGAVPFIARCSMWYLIVKQTKSIIQSGYLLSSLLRAFVAGFVGLLIVGLFLHVFEDSIVNYLFFIPFGLVWGKGLNLLAKSKTSKYNIS